MFSKIFITLYCFLFSSPIWAHPTYARLGYLTCTGCHISSDGAGLLTDYGKGISASESMFAKDLDSENMTQSNYHQAFQARLMNVNGVNYHRTFPMQFDYLSNLNINDHLSLNSILAVSPPPRNEAVHTNFFDRVYFRELGVQFIINNKTNYEDRLKLGVGLLPLGIGLVDHTAYVRATNRLSITDIPMHLSYYQNRALYDYDAFIFLPHPREQKDNAEKGIGGRAFYKINPKFSFGPQALLGDSPSISRKMGGLLAKWGMGKLSYLGEADYTKRKIKADSSQFSQWSIYQSLSFYPYGWLSPSITWQKLVINDTLRMQEQQLGFLLDWKIFKSFSINTEIRYKLRDGFNETEYLTQAYLNWW